jgi:hypothetical protein
MTIMAYVKMNPVSKPQDKMEKINARSNRSILYVTA